MSAFMHFASILAVLCFAFSAVADDFDDFRIPEHRVLGLSAHADGSFYKSSSKPIDERSDYWWVEGTVVPSLFALKESDKLRLSLYVFGAVDGRYQRSESRSVNDYYPDGQNHRRDVTKDNSVREAWQLDTDTRYYPLRVPLGVRFEVNARADYWQHCASNRNTWYGTQYDHVQVDDQETWLYDYYVSGTISLGLGKVRDVSGVVNAHIISDRLQREGLISTELSASTRQKLAELYYAESDYGYRHEFSEKYFWRDIGSVLRADPALLAQDLDAYSLYRLAETNHTGGIYREAGWFAGPALEGSHHSEIHRGWNGHRAWDDHNGVRENYHQDESSSSSHRSSDMLLGGVTAEYHKPFGLKWQLDLESTLLFPARIHDEHGIDWNSMAEVDYFIADRWSAATYIAHSRRDLVESAYYGYPGTQSRESVWLAEIGGNLRYHLEDQWAFTAGFEFGHSGYRYDEQYYYYFQPRKGTGYHLNGSLGITYHFIGNGLGYYQPPRPPRY